MGSGGGNVDNIKQKWLPPQYVLWISQNSLRLQQIQYTSKFVALSTICMQYKEIDKIFPKPIEKERLFWKKFQKTFQKTSFWRWFIRTQKNAGI